MSNQSKLDRARGALVGSALGDTIGIYTEFLSAEQAKRAYGSLETFSLVDPVTEFFPDRHRCRFETRAWTDDTDHAILILLSYLRNGDLLPDDFAKRLRTWCQQGLRCLDRLPMGLGRTVGSVVYNKDFLNDPSATAFAHWEKSGRTVAPNGSVMRTTPVGVVCMNDTEEQTFKTAIRMGAVTHADPRCTISVAIVSALIRGLCIGEVKTESDADALLERVWASLPHILPGNQLERDEFEKHAYAKSLDDLALSGGGMGYVYKCLGSSLWCLREVLSGRQTFKSAMVKLVMYGGDADTNGAVAGALMGSYCGYDALPPEWRDGMRHREWFLEKISALFIVSGMVDGTYDAKADVDTDFDGGKGFLSESEMKKREVEIMEKILLAEHRQQEAIEAKKKKKITKGVLAIIAEHCMPFVSSKPTN